MIDDPDLRQMFKAECEERLYNLEQHLLQLEKEPELPAPTDELFREAHSLKGLARMLGITNMEQLAHQFESVLKSALHNGQWPPVATLERLYHGVDNLRGLAGEAVTGIAAAESLTDMLARLTGEMPLAMAAKPEPVPAEAAQPVQEPAETPSPQASTTNKIDTIRVGTQQLDSLMTHVSELTVNKNRLAQRLGDANDLIFLWEEWKQYNRELYTPELAQLETRLYALRSQLYEDNNRFDYLNHEIGSGIRAIRLLPLSTTFNLFPRMVRDIAKQQRKLVNLMVEGDDTVADKRVIEEIKDPLTHLIRNAIYHAIEGPQQRLALGKPEAGTIRLKAHQTPTTIVITVTDDGAGINVEKIKERAIQNQLYTAEDLAAMNDRQVQELIFSQGFSTSDQINDISGRGLGMAIVRTTVEHLKGHIEVDSTPGLGTSIQIVLPITLATTQVIIVELQKRYFGIPMEAIELIRSVTPEHLFNIDGSLTLLQTGQAVSVARLSELLGIADTAKPTAGLAVIIANKHGRLAVLVDRLLDEQEILLKPLGGVLKRVRNISGVTVLGNGDICMVLNPHDLIKTAYGKKMPVPAKQETTSTNIKPHILYAEDSVTARTQIKRFLEKAGYLVTAAVDGRDAYEKLVGKTFAAVVSDVTMPNIDGLMLTEKIRRHPQYQQLPIILLSAMDKADDRRRALELGANAYLSKGAFDQRQLLDTLKTLV
ncbi:hybrid sensor histidine kinase/response regulator [Methylovulum miyakonense]|uniref:hybrid sensor histidine kinase/response regulator n=1 Tax=Methylovulum miyakonense TaxID=645578 RepID=UPI0003621EA9|nr:hybrid sensor histidine kinase/response regulator [Methylovulum miyakonense]